jgi:hypothetical protein
MLTWFTGPKAADALQTPLCPFGERTWRQKRSAGSAWLKSRLATERRQKEHRLAREIEERYSNDLDLLRSDVQLRQGREK